MGTPTTVERNVMTTGIAAFDKILGGGLPRQQSIIVTDEPVRVRPCRRARADAYRTALPDPAAGGFVGSFRGPSTWSNLR